MSDDPIDVFLCHNSADKEWVRRLAARIEAETIDGLPTSRMLRVFLDEWDIDVGQNIVNRLSDGLTKARYLAMAMSPEFFQSGWTNLEWTSVVADDPWGTNRKMIPLLLRDTSLDQSARITYPAPIKALYRLDFRQSRAFEKQFQVLMRRIRGLPPQRGTGQSRYSAAAQPAVFDQEIDASKPDVLREVLVSNLLEVYSYPTKIWGATTIKDKPGEVWQEIDRPEPFIIREKRLYTFLDLSHQDSALRKVVDVTSIKDISSREWILDPIKIIWWMGLLNQAISSHLSKLAIRRDDKQRYFFRPEKDGADRIWKNAGDRSRAVAAKKLNPATGRNFWVHHAARIKFKRIGIKFFLCIEPTFLFTVDGNAPVDSKDMGRLVVMWGGRQRNPDILRSLIFWAKSISVGRKQLRIETGGEPVVVSSLPALSVSNRGIELDHVRIGSLMNTGANELDEVAKDVEIIEVDEVAESGAGDEPSEE